MTNRTSVRRARASLGIAVLAVVLLACEPIPGLSIAATGTTLAARQATTSGWNVGVVADPTGARTSIVRFGGNGKASLRVVLSAPVDTLAFDLRGEACEGAPAFTVTVDKHPIATDSVTGAGWATKTYHRPLLAGSHTIDVEFVNDHSRFAAPTCDRNLFFDLVHLSASGAPAPGNAAVPAGFVHQSGTQLLDGANQPLQLRGVNLGGWLLWEGWIWGQGFDYVGQSAMMSNLTTLVGPEPAARFRDDVYANYVSADDFRAMSSYGLNVARVPFNSRMLEDDTNPFVYKDSGWATLDRVVAQAKQHDVYVVLDMHAAPCGQSMAFTADWTGSSYLWWSEQCQDRSVALWKAIAARYHDENIVAGFDLLNEAVTDDQQLASWYRSVIAAIREVDPNHTIIVEGNNLARDFTFLTGPLDDNEMLSVHDYPWMTTGEDVTARMPAYEAAAARLGAPLWLGEFGLSSYADIARYTDLFDASSPVAGWALWNWKQVPGYPTFQAVERSPAAQKLAEWMTNPSRSRPTPTEAQQGMVELVESMKFVNTTPDAKLQEILRR